MQNTRFQLLLERSPITDEDRYNISRIFSILSPERQVQIISWWDAYIARFIAIRDHLQEAEARRFLSWLRAIDVLLDEAVAKEHEKQDKKNENKRQIRSELEATVAYTQMQRLRQIKNLQGSWCAK